ncbi:MAG: hypothetical protein ACP5VF_07910 [Acidobacteriota bacterium]
MAKRHVLLALALAASLVPLGASQTVQVLQDLRPEVKKKLPAGYAVEGLTYSFQDKRFSISATPLTPLAREAYYAKRKLKDPFADATPAAGYIFFLIRIENRQKTDMLYFSPGNVMFGNMNPIDEIAMYQLFYRLPEANAKLDAAGRSFFLRDLHLPPGLWIERLMVFQYDDPYPTKKINLALTSILLGGEGLDVNFPFIAKFKKEKVE